MRKLIPLAALLSATSVFGQDAPKPHITTLPITERKDDANLPMLYVPGNVNGHNVTLLLDTGAQPFIISPRYAVGAEVLGHASAQGVGGLAKVTIIRATVKLGDDVFPGQVMESANFNLGPLTADGILGEAVLSQYSKVTIDYKAHTLILEK